MRILILDNNINFSKDLTSRLSNNKDLEVILTTRDRNNTYEKFAMYKPDIAVIDYYLPKEGTLKLLERLKSGNNNHSPLCIMTFPDFEKENLDDTPIHDCLNAGAYGFFIKSQDKDDLVKTINKTAMELKKAAQEYNERIKKNLSDEITELLKDLSIPGNLYGFRYIREAILLSYENEKHLEAVTKELYPIIDKNCNIKKPNKENTKANKDSNGHTHKDKSALAVERAIRNAISKGNFDNNIYNFVIKDGKTRPTTKEFLRTIVSHLHKKS